MTSSARPATQTIVVDYELPVPPAKVWHALTDPELLAAWLMPNDIQPKVGHRFTFRAPPSPGWDGVVQCEVLAVEPTTRLVYSWRSGSSASERYTALDSTVTWTLAPTASGTRLHLEHSGFEPANSFAFENMNKGWRGHIAERLADVAAKLR